MTCVLVVGDYNAEITAHVAIDASLTALGERVAGALSHRWVHTSTAEREDFGAADGIWCTPASPYASEAGAMRAIAHARTSATPFLGTCGGYQYAVLEYARRVLGLKDADNTEVNPDTPTPVINGLQCALVEVQGRVNLLPDSQAAALAGDTAVQAAYHCSYGVNRAYLSAFVDSELRFTGFDGDGDPRVFEHAMHPFFIGTAFQPERAALSGPPHALVMAFAEACARFHAQRND
ncbi:MAG: hypothetical protein AAGA11_11730 [Pseudomonadota bacterium]